MQTQLGAKSVTYSRLLGAVVNPYSSEVVEFSVNHAVRCAKFYVALEGRRHWTSKEEQRKHFFVTTTTG